MSAFPRWSEEKHAKASCGKPECGEVRARPIREIAAVVVFLCFGISAAASQRTGAKTATAWRADGGELRIVAADVQLLLIAPDGKETGYDPRAKKEVREIPRSSYFEDALAAFDSGRVDRSTTQTLAVRRPQAGKYRLMVSAGYLTSGEQYEARVTLYRRDSSEAASVRIAGMAERGRAAAYEVVLGGSGGKAMVVKRAEASSFRR